MPTDFEQRVYRAVQQVPRGRVTTYRLLAAHLRCGSPRAVGQALRRNPYAPRVPCQRVIAADLTPGGFRGETGGSTVKMKLSLLSSEGVRFSHGHLADPRCLYAFET